MSSEHTDNNERITERERPDDDPFRKGPDQYEIRSQIPQRCDPRSCHCTCGSDHDLLPVRDPPQKRPYQKHEDIAEAEPVVKTGQELLNSDSSVNDHADQIEQHPVKDCLEYDLHDSLR